MKQDRKHRLHGFTLLEMMIVLGIIGILLGVLLPNMTNYLTKSRLNTANSNAKVLFNSIQTIMQEYEFNERVSDTSLFYGNLNPSKGAVTPVTDRVIYIECDKGRINTFDSPVTVAAADYGADPNNAVIRPSTFGARVLRLFSDYEDVSWVAYIENYTVRGVLCATEMNVGYVGGYPMRINEKSSTSNPIPSTSAGALNALDKSQMKNYSDAAWS